VYIAHIEIQFVGYSNAKLMHEPRLCVASVEDTTCCACFQESYTPACILS